MMRLRQSLKSSVRTGLNFLVISIFVCGCSSSTTPTYKVSDIEKAITDICKNEYKIDIVARLTAETLWIYIPVEDLLIKSEKPEKYTDKFEISETKPEFAGGDFSLEYAIKGVKGEEKIQEVTYNKKVIEKTDNVWKALRRVIFSMERSKKAEEPKFFYLITADIKNGFETNDLFYYLDLKKVSYGFISPGEFQHRSVQETKVDPRIIADAQGKHLNYSDITMKDFIAGQVKHRIRLKFQKPEVKENADIDKEVEKVIYLTFDIYNFRDFNEVDLFNSLTKNRIILNRAAVLADTIEQKY